MSVAIDILHVLVTGAWLGELFAVAVAGRPIAMPNGLGKNVVTRLGVASQLVNAFSQVALTPGRVVAFTGVLAGRMHVG